MPLALYNSLARSVETFEPLEAPVVRVYGCGPTIYGRAHIGNFRTFVAYDLFHRYLVWKGLEPRFVVNFTDVDDKTIDGAAARGVELDEFTRPWGDAFLADAETLGLRPFHSIPRATEQIGPMIGWIRRLEEKGLAYQTSDGSVYFRISAWDDYGKLSGNRGDAESGRSRIDADEYEKDDVRDFVLWKAARDADREVGAVWESPWGPGRPGWHLECSVLSIHELGETLDVHMGGEDLLFPHHENEIAQSEGATGKPFARFWVHTRHLRVEGEKMSKSLGNTYTIPDLLEKGHSAAAIRHLLLSAQYSKELNFTFDGLEGSARAVQRLLDFHDRLESLAVSEGEANGQGDGALGTIADRALASFEAALDDDLNAPEGWAALFGFVKEGNAALDAVEGTVGPAQRQAALDALHSMDEVFGVLALALRDRGVDPETESWIEERIEARAQARRDRDFEEADAIRDELEEAGFVLEDSAEGTRWKRVG